MNTPTDSDESKKKIKLSKFKDLFEMFEKFKGQNAIFLKSRD